MKLRELVIHNFRGILKCRIILHDYSLLVGANNSGKSAVIDALRAFYEKDGYKFKKDRDFPFLATTDSESWVDLTFELPDEEFASLPDQYKHDPCRLCVRKYFLTDDKAADGKSKAGGIFGYLSDGTVSDKLFHGWRNVQHGKFGDIIFIPAVSKVDEHTKLSGASALRDLLSSVLEDVVSASQAYKELDQDFGTFAAKIKGEEAPDGRSLSGLETRINEALKSWGATFQLDLRSPSTAELIKTLMQYQCVDSAHGRPQAAEQFGSGFQRHFVYSLIRIGATYVRPKVTAKAKEFSPDMTLLLFEEPEAFLHPPQQYALWSSLLALAGSETRQVLCSSHSSHFVSKNASHIPGIVRLERIDGQMKARQISSSDWDEIVNANQSINKLGDRYPQLALRLREEDATPEIESLKYFLWLNSERSNLFFADQVLLVEGPTEQALINRLIEKRMVVRGGPGLYVLDCMGKYNIHRFMNLLSKYGIRHSVIYDDDGMRNHHKEIHELIQGSRDPQLTIEANTVRGKIETLLAIPERPNARDKKPQYALYMLENDQFDVKKLRAFCALVEATISGESSKVLRGAPADTGNELEHDLTEARIET